MNANTNMGSSHLGIQHGNSGLTLVEPQLASASSTVRDALVIGDIHGHLNRLEGILKQEGILGPCPDCDGFGDIPTGEIDPGRCGVDICLHCNGDGQRRINHDVDVILVGDIGHFGRGGSPTGDFLTWKYAMEWADVILWGNHDRAVVDPSHTHSGLEKGMIETEHLMRLAMAEGKLKLAVARHGFLITHAGLHSSFRNQKVENNIKHDAGRFVEWINQVNGIDSLCEPDQAAVRDAIGRNRGGWSPVGGILWRDINEKLYPGFRQIFGHSADHKEHKVRYCWENMFTRSDEGLKFMDDPSYCIDIGGKSDQRGSSENCIAGIWLPSERIVTWNG